MLLNINKLYYIEMFLKQVMSMYYLKNSLERQGLNKIIINTLFLSMRKML